MDAVVVVLAKRDADAVADAGRFVAGRQLSRRGFDARAGGGDPVGQIGRSSTRRQPEHVLTGEQKQVGVEGNRRGRVA